MRIFLFELQKIICKKRFILILLCAVILNSGVILKQVYSDNIVKPESYKAIYTDIDKMSNKEKSDNIENKIKDIDIINQISMANETKTTDKLNLSKEDLLKYIELYSKGGYLKYCSKIYEESELLRSVREENKRINGYGAFLENIEKTSKTMNSVSIFSKKNTFTYRNNNKTAEDFREMSEVKPTLTNSKGINLAIFSIITDIIAIFLLLYISTLLIFSGKEEEHYSLTRPTFKGRGSLFGAKFLTMLVTSFVVELILYATNFIIAGLTYGFGDFSVAIQSISGFNGSILKCNLIEYLIFYFLTKYVAYVLISMVFILICEKAKSITSVYLYSVIVIGVESLLYFLVPPFCSLNFFKHINLINLFNTNDLYSSYVNINMFSYPVNVLPLTMIATIVFLAILLILSIKSFKEMQSLSTRNGIHIFHFKFGNSVKLLSQEGYKLLVSNKSWLIIIILIIIEGYAFINYSPTMSEEDIYYSGYMNRLSGTLTEEKEDFIKSEQQKFNKIEQMMNESLIKLNNGEITKSEYQGSLMQFSTELKTKTSFQKVEERYKYIKNSKSANNLVFVNDLGYENLFDFYNDSESFKNSLLLFAVIIGCFAGLFSMEHSGGMKNLINVYKKGRGITARRKIMVSELITVPLAFICYAPNIINTINFYKIGELGAPACSLPSFSSIPPNISLFGALFLSFAQKLIIAMFATAIVLCISELFKNTIASFFVSGVVLLIPTLLHLLGINLLDTVTINYYLSTKIMQNFTYSGITIAYLIVLILFLTCSCADCKLFSRSRD